LNVRANYYRSCKIKYDKFALEIKHNEEKLKKGKGAIRRDNLEYYLIGSLFYAITLALVAVYFFFWYNAIFASHSSANTYTSLNGR
jgi:hypothetical protein